MRNLLDTGTVSLLHPPSPKVTYPLPDVRTIREQTQPTRDSMLFLSICNDEPKARVSNAFLGEHTQPALEALEAEAVAHAVVIVLHTGEDKGIQQDLEAWKEGQLAAGRTALDILVLSGKALKRHLPALATRPHLLKPSSA